MELLEPKLSFYFVDLSPKDEAWLYGTLGRVFPLLSLGVPISYLEILIPAWTISSECQAKYTHEALQKEIQKGVLK